MATHTIEPTRETLHGVFSLDFSPVLTIDPGDTVVNRLLDAAWALEPHRADGAPRRTFAPRDPARDDGHALCGPVAVRGAEPGMALGVRIDELCPATAGWTVAGVGDAALDRRLGVEIDCKELVAGSTLYLPVAVPGGLFSVGDGHAAQGDGEVAGTAVECPMERAGLTFDLHLTTPRAETPAGRITFGFAEDLHEATMRALEAMVTWIEVLHGLDRRHAVALASVAVDPRVTQLVNRGVVGVHALLPNGALRGAYEPGRQP